MPPDGWTLLASMAASKERFLESASLAETTAFLILRNQLALGVRSRGELESVAEAVGPDAMNAALRALAVYEVRRILDNIEPALGASQLNPADARKLLASLMPGASISDVDAPSFTLPPALPMRRHKALGARRIRA